MLTVELVYDPDCPNVQRAREQLRWALAKAGLPVQWQEWNRAAPEAPGYARQYGSPTFLVNGRDVAGVSPADGANNCRVYPDDQGRLARVPTVEMLTTALSQAIRETSRAERATSARKRWRTWP